MENEYLLKGLAALLKTKARSDRPSYDFLINLAIKSASGDYNSTTKFEEIITQHSPELLTGLIKHTHVHAHSSMTELQKSLSTVLGEDIDIKTYLSTDES